MVSRFLEWKILISVLATSVSATCTSVQISDRFYEICDRQFSPVKQYPYYYHSGEVNPVEFLSKIPQSGFLDFSGSSTRICIESILILGLYVLVSNTLALTWKFVRTKVQPSGANGSIRYKLVADRLGSLLDIRKRSIIGCILYMGYSVWSWFIRGRGLDYYDIQGPIDAICYMTAEHMDYIVQESHHQMTDWGPQWSGSGYWSGGYQDDGT